MSPLVHEDVEKKFAGDVERDANLNTIFACIAIGVEADTIEDVVEYKHG